jgi:hypothetical protein
MAERAHQQRGPERRRQPRGGRRPTDTSGYAPLVFVIDPRPTRDACEAILAKLRFAVAPFETVAQATRVITALSPDIILVSTGQIETLRSVMAPRRDQAVIPIVPIPEHDGESVALIDAVRVALRLAPARR